MDKFDGYGGLFLQEIDPELEAALKQCKTEDERKEVMQEYFQTKVIAAIITIGVGMIIIIFIGVILYFCK